MTFGVRASCVVLRRCGSSRALPKTQYLHQERNTKYVSLCLSSSSTVSQGGGFRALATRASSLSCVTGSADGGAFCLISSIRRVSSNLFNLFKRLFSPQRYHALHPTSTSSGDPSRMFDSHASNRCYQQGSMVSRRNPKLIVVRTPPSCLRRSWRTPPQHTLQRQ